MEPIVFKPKYSPIIWIGPILLFGLAIFKLSLAKSDEFYSYHLFAVSLDVFAALFTMFFSFYGKITKITFDQEIVVKRILRRKVTRDYFDVIYFDQKYLDLKECWIVPAEIFPNSDEFLRIIDDLVARGKIQSKKIAEKKKKTDRTILCITFIAVLIEAAILAGAVKVSMALHWQNFDLFLDICMCIVLLSWLTSGLYGIVKSHFYNKLRLQE